MPVDAYTAYTDGMTEDQIKQVDARLERDKFYKGDNNLNRTDLWKRYHTGRTKGFYKGKGAHQVANKAGVDGPTAKAKWAELSPDERFESLETFVDDMKVNRRIGQEANMNARMLLGSKNTPDNIYGGNFSQRILNPRNPEFAESTAKKTKVQRLHYQSQPSLDAPPVRPKPSRKAVKALAAAGIAAPSIVGTGVSAAETHQRAQLAIDTKNPMDFVQAGLSGLSFLADFIPGVGELISTPADIANLTIDGHREPKTVQSQVSKLHAIKLNR
jgi:hypothetical protein